MNVPKKASDAQASRTGVLLALVAYGSWGVFPAFWKLLGSVPAHELLAQRVVWSFVFFMGLSRIKRGGWKELRDILQSRKALSRLLISTALISVNWYLFIYAIQEGRIIEASLGYFITPLLNVAVGRLVLAERLRTPQWVAVALAAVGVTALTIGGHGVPWIALSLASSFTLYGLVRKTFQGATLAASTVETAFLVLPCLAFLGLGETVPKDGGTWGLLVLSGAITAVPLLCFAAAARKLRFTTLGLFQYLAPSLQFLLAVLAYGEPFDATRAFAFAWIWAGLLLYAGDSLGEARNSFKRAARSRA